MSHMLSGLCSAASLLSHLEEVCWQLFMSVTIIEGQSCGEAGHRDAMLDSSADCSAPWLLNKEIEQVKNGFAHGALSHLVLI